MHWDFAALDDITFDIKKGESWGFIGVNGSGKSTLLKMISGSLRPTAGRIEVDGKVVMLDYSSGLHGEFTGRENIYLKGAMLGMSHGEVDEKLEAILEFAGIGEFIDQPVKTYSSGMTARLGFAIIAHVDADIIITDEALAVGDAFFVQKCMRHIRKFLEHGTFLFVSHSTNDVVSLCEKAVWLDHGKVRKIGTAKDVAEAYLSQHIMEQSRRLQAETEEGSEAKAVGGDAAAVEEATGQPDHNAKAEPEGRMVRLADQDLADAMNAKPARVIKDPRQKYLNCSNMRNDLEIVAFDPDADSVGVGGACIEEVLFEDDSGAQLTWVIGGEMVSLTIRVRAERALARPLVGFQIKDRLGQVLFADNTALVTQDQGFSVPVNGNFVARFTFQMPLLPVGSYAVYPAVAEGSDSEAVMLHIVESPLVFNSVTSGARHGLVGVPMQEVVLEIESSGVE